MSRGAIVEYTEQVAGEIAAQYGDRPMDELRLWLALAHQREAMVSSLYDIDKLEQRFAGARADAASGVARGAMLSIWAHEEKHTTFLGSIRSVTEGLPQFRAWQGEVEGLVTRYATNGSALARFFIAIGASLGRVPDFARELGSMTIAELFAFNAELESTARMGYQRILQLLRAVGDDPRSLDELGYTFRHDIARILCEECFHEAAFDCMTDWVGPDGVRFRELPGAECVRELHAICEQHLSVPAAQRILASEGSGVELGVGDGDPREWVSDGGLGDLFRTAGLPVRVAHHGRPDAVPTSSSA